MSNQHQSERLVAMIIDYEKKYIIDMYSAKFKIQITEKEIDEEYLGCESLIKKLLENNSQHTEDSKNAIEDSKNAANFLDIINYMSEDTSTATEDSRTADEVADILNLLNQMSTEINDVEKKHEKNIAKLPKTRQYSYAALNAYYPVKRQAIDEILFNFITKEMYVKYKQKLYELQNTLHTYQGNIQEFIKLDINKIIKIEEKMKVHKETIEKALFESFEYLRNPEAVTINHRDRLPMWCPIGEPYYYSSGTVPEEKKCYPKDPFIENRLVGFINTIDFKTQHESIKKINKDEYNKYMKCIKEIMRLQKWAFLGVDGIAILLEGICIFIKNVKNKSIKKNILNGIINLFTEEGSRGRFLNHKYPIIKEDINETILFKKRINNSVFDIYIDIYRYYNQINVDASENVVNVIELYIKTGGNLELMKDEYSVSKRTTNVDYYYTLISDL
jgi:hypothetical protein